MSKRKDGGGAEQAPGEDRREDCEHYRSCNDCRDQSRDFGATGSRIVGWCEAIELLADRLSDAETAAEDVPVLRDAIYGLTFAIATLTDQEIVSETLAPREDLALAGRYQAPQILKASPAA